MLLATILLIFGAAEAIQKPLSQSTKRYDGYKVFSVIPRDEAALALLREWLVNDIDVDFWQEPSRIGKAAEFMVKPKHLYRYLSAFRKNGIEFTVKVDNVQDTLTPMWDAIDLRKMQGKQAFDLNEFNTYEDIMLWMDSMVGNCRSGLNCEVYTIGNSYENRPINVFKISKNGVGRKAYWVDATIHAREWIATTTACNLLDRLARGVDADAIRLTDDYDWYILLVMNPDGYSYTWTNDRYWRKNRRPSSGSPCIGADLNRNFDFRWGTDGVSHAPCSDLFCGESGGSEPETQAVSNELVKLGPTLAATVTIHAYGYMWMFPWGNTVNHAGQVCDLADDHDDMMVVADATANAIENTYNTDNWARGNSCVVIYETSGGTDDFAKGVAGVKYAFCPELRGNDFVIAPVHIPLSAEEFYNGIVAMVDSIGA